MSISILQQISQAALGNSPVLGRVGVWIAAHPLRTISFSADEVAVQAGASLAAVNRFARSAGFRGFAHLKDKLSVELQEASEPIQKLASGLMRSTAPGRPSGAADWRALAQQNVRLAGQALDDKMLTTIAKRLLNSANVYTLGLGVTTYLADLAGLALMPYAPNVNQASGEGGTEQAARRLMRIGEGDLLLAISLPRYSRDTVELARYASRRGAFVVAITDRAGAPLAAQADVVLLAPAAHPVLSSSAVATVAVIEALVARVMQLNPDSVRIATELSESVFKHLDAGKPGHFI